MKRRRVTVYAGTGSPEGAVAGVVHDLYFRKDGSGTTSRYCKESGGAGEVGWVACGDSPGGGTPATTVVSETSYGAASAVGVATNYAREDHTHGTPALGSTGTTACAGNDARLSNARTPTTHATTHQHNGSDEIATSTAAANAIPKAGAGGTLAIGWIPTGSTSSTVCIGNDSRLSDARAPTAHSHSLADITDEGALASLSTVGAAQIDAGAVSPAKTSFSPSAPEAGKFLKATGAGTVAWDAPTASVAISTASVAFTDGDTARRVTITDAAVSAASKVLCSVRRPDTTDDSADRGYIYIPNVVKCASGSFDVLIACLDIGGMDPTMNPPNETITLNYQVA